MPANVGTNIPTSNRDRPYYEVACPGDALPGQAES